MDGAGDAVSILRGSSGKTSAITFLQLSRID
jgi:hypothetical protein